MINLQQATVARNALLNAYKQVGNRPRWLQSVDVAKNVNGDHVVRVVVDGNHVRNPNHIGGDYAPFDPKTSDFRYAKSDLRLPSSVQGVPVVAQHMAGPLFAGQVTVTGFDWPSPSTWLDEAKSYAQQQLDTRQQQATQDVQSTVQQQAQSQGSLIRQQIAPALAQTQETAKTIETVALILGVVAVVGVGYYIMKGS